MNSKKIPTVGQAEFEALAMRNPNLLHESPWIVDGYIGNWPAYDSWRDLAHLRARFGHLEAFAKAPNFTTHRKSRLVSVKTRFDQYLDYIEHPERIEAIYEGCWLDGDFDAFQKMDMPLYCGTLRIVHGADDPVFRQVAPLLPKPLRSWNHALPYYYTLFNHFWLLVSLPGALTPLHTDNNGTIALIAQLRGRKRATLFSPDDLRYVRNANGDFLDPDNEADHEFPEASKAQRWSGDIEEGQVLFVGTNWAHHVRTLETSISVSFDFVDRTNLAAYATAAGWAAALGNRAKSNADLFVRKLGGRVSAATIARFSAVTVGRLVMAEILRAVPHHAEDEATSIRALYATHLQQCLHEVAQNG